MNLQDLKNKQPEELIKQADKIGIDKFAQQIAKHRNADVLTWPESQLMNTLADSKEKIANFVPDTSNPSKRT